MIVKLQIKTLSQKSILIDIDDGKTVFDLKKELSLYPDVGVKPELQKLIYAGKILTNDDQLSVYNIDIKKFLVVMILKQPLEESPTTSKSTTSAIDQVETKETKEFKVPKAVAAAALATATKSELEKSAASSPIATSATKTKHEEMVENIVSMGYPETEVRSALAASFNNPERAIEYLIEGIPASSTQLEGVDANADVTMSPFEMFRRDPLFRNLRSAIQQHPELIDDAIQRVGEANPGILNLINENQQEFLSMLIEGSDDDEEDDSA